MFEGLVASVINKFLGDYVANLETKQLSIGIWQGDVVLHKSEAEKGSPRQVNLPVDVLEGYMGDLTIYIPWNDLKNKPVKVFINNVYLLAHPKADSDYDPVLEEDRAHKDKCLVRAFRFSPPNSWTSNVGTDNKQNASFIAQLVTKIVDNLQITIKNIHIRYEDKVMKSSEHPLAVGITLSELSAVSTDENWNEAFIHEEVGLFIKVSVSEVWPHTGIPIRKLGWIADE
ncbi:N-terminal region of Chorein, a TM vesicle-mediated sorter-domain-containing protein [Chytridium lagenaria]|nr:N-terminal region of Chorein, a TM vesicle-mediated sorter-domain-containing protein [Chytridium lagenaria]